MEKDHLSFYELYGSTDPNKVCIHEVCPVCHGTLKKDDGTVCEHFLACPCVRCMNKKGNDYEKLNVW